jgi:hypothetical protein
MSVCGEIENINHEIVQLEASKSQKLPIQIYLQIESDIKELKRRLHRLEKL